MLASSYSKLRLRDVLKLHRAGRLNLAPAFQRKSVWSTRDRQRLLISVFDGIPLPTVYLYERALGTVPGRVQYDVIDGKQRLESLMLFTGEGPLAEAQEPLRFRGDLDGEEALEWRHWADLNRVQKKRFLDTIIPVIEVTGELGEVAELFVNINSTGKRLTGQERRHAFYDHSNVLKAASSLAEQQRDAYQRRGVFSRTQMDRMLHIEFTTELLLYAYDDSHLNKKTRLDEIIRGDRLDPALLRGAVASVEQALETADLILPNLASTRFRRKADFYSVITLLMQLKRDGQVVRATWSQRNELAGELLKGFGLNVDEISHLTARAQPIPANREQHVKYLMTVKEGTDTAAQRKRRAAILNELLTGVFDTQDIYRAFNDEQRRILWNRSKTQECAICGERIQAWTDMNADHIQAYVKGGRTDLGNGAITHQKCNQRKGAN